MHEMRDHTHSATAFHAMALVASARAALGTARQIASRRAGRDPSEQEPEAPVRADLAVLRDALAEQVVRLRLRAVVGPPEAPAAALAQQFEDRLLLDDVARTTRRAHQKLLSLYPAVPDDLVEEARQLAVEAERGALADDVDARLDRLAGRAADWLDRLGKALA
jgi:hypothetical protein